MYYYWSCFKNMGSYEVPGEVKVAVKVSFVDLSVSLSLVILQENGVSFLARGRLKML